MCTVITRVIVRRIVWSKLHSTTKVLIFRCRTMSFDSIKIELTFVGCSTYASLVHLNLVARWSLLYILFTTVGLLVHFLSWVAKLVEFTVLNVHWLWLRASLWYIWWNNLGVVSSGLRSSFDLVLDLGLLFFIRVSDLNTLTDLLMLWSI